MKRTHNYKLRQLPTCSWCFVELDKAGKKFCSPVCTEAAKNWKLSKFWDKIGKPVMNDGEYPTGNTSL